MKIEGHYRTKIILLRYQLDQCNYEQTLDKFVMCAFKFKSTQWQKKKCDYAKCCHHKNIAMLQTNDTIRLNMDDLVHQEDKKNTFVTLTKRLSKTS